MMGLLQQTKGSMFIDDQPITKKNHRAWQAHIAHVPQVIFLSDATIGENIAFGVPLELIDFDRVREAAKKAKISQTVESWAEQYSTKVGERGVRLSGGQRQRIGIARALYKQADVIVLDEATSALDNDTEGAVMEAINNIDEGITVLIVAHRLSTLKGCSQIVELSNGVIKRTGTYKEIIG
jgi:ATP-binding cassette subfamily B protein